MKRELTALRSQLSYPGWAADAGSADVRYPSLFASTLASMRQKQQLHAELTALRSQLSYPGWAADAGSADVRYPSTFASTLASMRQKQQEHMRRRRREDDETAEQQPRQRRRIEPPSLPRPLRRSRDDAAEEAPPTQRPRVQQATTDVFKSDNACVVCLDAAKTHIFVPCGHLCVCESCTTSLNLKCPICRATASLVMRTYQ